MPIQENGLGEIRVIGNYEKSAMNESDWALMNEEQKYAEWSAFTSHFSGYLHRMPTYVEYCNGFDEDYGVSGV